jgi:16S rRNA (adenine1518-N6/adenine1519-N6)-dimethyltransferase
MQREVAERVCAPPGSRDYGYLSVATQSQAEATYLFTVPPGAFQPPPKVDSAVLRLIPREERPPARFLEFASAAFRQKRKTLRNNLSRNYPQIAEQPEAGLRAEQLGVPELLSLFTRLSG